MTEIIWDRRAEYIYTQTHKDKFEKIKERYYNFIENTNDENAEPIKVFDGLKPFQIEELELIREVSRELQKKKEDDINKAKADAEAAEAEAKKIEESKEENSTEESAEETNASQEQKEV